MKKIIFTIVLVCSISTSLANEVKLDSIKNIEIKKVGFYITTFAKVHCSEFDFAFDRELFKNLVITSEDSLEKFYNLFSKLEPIEDTEKNLPDTRGVVIINYLNGSIDVICLSLNRISFNGQPMAKNEEFIDYIRKAE